MKNKIIMYGADWCPDCRRTKDFLQTNHIEFEFVNVDLNPEAAGLVENINQGKRIIPTLLINGSSYTNKQNHEIAAVLGINPQGIVQMYGADWCPDCRRVKRFLQDHEIHFQFIDVELNAKAADWVTTVNKGKRIIPTLLINDKAYTNPNHAQLSELLAVKDEVDNRIYDTVIIGGGAAGLTTAIYAQRDKFDALILEQKNIGGNAFITKKIENYPGFQEVSGPELMDKMALQASALGAKIETGIEVLSIEKQQQYFKIITKAKKDFKAKTVVIATGSTYRLLNIPGEEELIGSGVHFCATCDGAFYRNKKVIVIGGGNSALEEGIFLAGFCEKVIIVHRSENFSASEIYIEKLKGINNIEIYLNHTPISFNANPQGVFLSATLKNNANNSTLDLVADGVFIFIGLTPNTTVFEGMLNVSSTHHLLTKGLNETNVPGIFAAGDCRHGAIAQVAAATGEGVVASYGIKAFLRNQT